MNVLVLQPNRGTLFTESQEAIEREFRSNSAYPAIVRATGLPLLEAREFLVDRALNILGWDTCIMVDDDIVLPEGSFKMFDKKLQEFDIAIIDYPHHHHELLSKVPPTGVTVFTQYLPGEDITKKIVAWSGLGACAMRRKTLQSMRDEYRPLFKRTAWPVHVDELGRMSLVAVSDMGVSNQPKTYSGGEDTQFFFDAKKLGFTIGLIDGPIAKHLRLDFAVSWAADDKYVSVHTIEVSDKITRPGNELHRENQ